MRLFLPIFLFFFTFSTSVVSEQKIVFVDMDRLISVSKPGSSIFDQLKDINEKNIISESDFTANVEELKSEINNYNQNRNKMIEKFNQLKVDSTNNLLKLINPILTKFSNDNEISIILQKKDLIMGKTELDITDQVIKIINNEIKEFKIK